ncbi:MAG TPA: flagellar M-ring protein FliF [Aquifex aeolicus]|nr:flagellar M-ring protein FliF [Aquificales bacterium]HIQ26154.1 flagellar M-ring protein FliF [Aquifex aeolicus]
MEKIKEFWNKFLDWYKGLNLWQKIAVAGVPILATASLLLVAYLATPHREVLFSNLDPSTLQKIEYTLSRLGVDYKIDFKKGTVYVPADKVNQLRLYLTEQGIISPDNKVGFEIFDKQSFTVSDFAQQVNYLRALEGELERTIKAIEAVDDVKVNIALPRQSVFARPQEEPRASVLLKLKPGKELSPQQIKAIRNLVVASVVGLKPQNVVIVDQYGRELTSFIEEETSSIGLATNQLKLKLHYENILQKEIENILSSVVGFGNSKVKVSLYLDFSKHQEKNYEVNPDKTAIVSQEKEKKQKRTVEPVGVPGTESNIPPGKGKGSQATSVETSKRSITNYEVSYVERLIDDPTVRIKKISVGVIINSSIKEIEPEKIKQFLISSLGLNLSRGDKISVVVLPFKGKEEVEKLFAQRKKKELDWRIYAGLILLLAIILGAALFFYIKRKKTEEELEKVEVYGGLTGAPAGAAAIPEKAEESLIKQLSRLAKENPELYKKILLKWLKTQE